MIREQKEITQSLSNWDRMQNSLIRIL